MKYLRKEYRLLPAIKVTGNASAVMSQRVKNAVFPARWDSHCIEQVFLRYSVRDGDIADRHPRAKQIGRDIASLELMLVCKFYLLIRLVHPDSSRQHDCQADKNQSQGQELNFGHFLTRGGLAASRFHSILH